MTSTALHRQTHSAGHRAALESDNPAVLEATIEEERRQLHQSIDELKDVVQERVHDATDWRLQFGHHPYAAMGVALTVGVIAGAQSGRHHRRKAEQREREERAYQQPIPPRYVKPSAVTGMFGILLGMVGRRVAELAEDYFRDQYHQYSAMRKAPRKTAPKAAPKAARHPVTSA